MRLKIAIDLDKLDQGRVGEQVAYILRELADDLEDGEVLGQDLVPVGVLTFAARQVGAVKVDDEDETVVE